jgi:hypothetical protein
VAIPSNNNKITFVDSNYNKWCGNRFRQQNSSYVAIHIIMQHNEALPLIIVAMTNTMTIACMVWQ